jgi:hypothetical protein
MPASSVSIVLFGVGMSNLAARRILKSEGESTVFHDIISENGLFFQILKV